ncbi:MAG: metal ABC transporter permease [Proteobacteria bacterium]|nr:metal ABC transporter permease [Pseudomonadota bacterium]
MNTITQFANNLFAYEFMRNAFIAGTLAAVVASLMGYFVVLRRQNFAAHALSHIGFAGAAGAGLVSLDPASGQLILTILAAFGMGGLGARATKSDIAVGVTLAFALGLGMLFLYFYSNYASRAMAILFGNLLSVSPALIKKMAIYSIISLVGLAGISRPLLFASLEPELAEAKGISLPLISVLFLILVSIAITEASQVVGILLVFTLLIGPAASASYCTRNFWTGLVLSMLLGLVTVWVGLILTYFTNWPVSFWISALSLVIYLLFRYLSASARV